MQRSSLYFLNNETVDVRTETCPAVNAEEVLIASRLSAISAGTELLFYRGKLPSKTIVDEHISNLKHSLEYPLKYGYAVVGKIIDCGEKISAAYRGKRVFSFHPHESIFSTRAEDIVLLPEDLSDEDAVFLPFMETAVSFIMDGLPMIGERAVVIGQGIIGLLTTALLTQFPLESLVTFDRHMQRCAASKQMGATESYIIDEARAGLERRKADITYEISGFSAALQDAIAVTGFNGRIIIGSWYGDTASPVVFNEKFHRSRIRLLSSQVSTIDPRFSGRWTRDRRLSTVIAMLKQCHPSRLISHRFHFVQAEQAYRMLSTEPASMLQTVFLY
jgi:2-desacetyl-2-hydroxyethyl bacteriochlorophyllide A dehydrogenase